MVETEQCFEPLLPKGNSSRLKLVAMKLYDLGVCSLDLLICGETPLNTLTYFNIVADHVHPFMVTMFPDDDSHFQQDNAPCHRPRFLSNWFR